MLPHGSSLLALFVGFVVLLFADTTLANKYQHCIPLQTGQIGQRLEAQDAYKLHILENKQPVSYAAQPVDNRGPCEVATMLYKLKDYTPAFPVFHKCHPCNSQDGTRYLVVTEKLESGLKIKNQSKKNIAGIFFQIVWGLYVAGDKYCYEHGSLYASPRASILQRRVDWNQMCFKFLDSQSNEQTRCVDPKDNNSHIPVIIGNINDDMTCGRSRFLHFPRVNEDTIEVTENGEKVLKDLELKIFDTPTTRPFWTDMMYLGKWWSLLGGDTLQDSESTGFAKLLKKGKISPWEAIQHPFFDVLIGEPEMDESSQIFAYQKPLSWDLLRLWSQRPLPSKEPEPQAVPETKRKSGVISKFLNMIGRKRRATV